MTETTISTAHILLTAGKATFTLEGKGRRFTYRIECVESPDRGSIYFAKLLKGPSNEHDYVYIGVYDPVNGWIHLTKKCQFADNTECVRALRWYVSLVWSGRETEIESAFLADIHRPATGSAWVYNGEGTAERPGDLGYWVGYRIAKAYYLGARDKSAALRDILTFADPDRILSASGWRPGVDLAAP